MDIGEIGIIGGTGKQGSALAKRLYRKGYNIRIGSRSKERGANKANLLMDELESIDNAKIRGGENKYALEAPVVVLAIPVTEVEKLLGPHLDILEDTIIIDMTVNLKFGKYIKTDKLDGKSSYEFVREFLPKSKVAASLKTISATVLDNDEPLDQFDFIMSTDEEAYHVANYLSEILGLNPVRVKGKVHAHTIERMVALSIQLNKSYPGSHVGYKLAHFNPNKE